MKWTKEAQEAIKRVPFFVKKRVRKRIEQEAASRGSTTVTIDDVHATRNRFLEKMSENVRGYRVDTCFSQGKCPNSANRSADLADRIEALLEKEDLRGFLEESIGAQNIKLHHELGVSISECPNACSQPQIRDIGIIGACRPKTTEAGCDLCGRCIEVCREKAVTIGEDGGPPAIDLSLCLYCGGCARECPTGAITEGERGYRVLLGGKLGRHPKLATELPGLFAEEEVLEIVKRCVAFYKANSKNGARFSDLYKGPGCIGIKNKQGFADCP